MKRTGLFLVLVIVLAAALVWWFQKSPADQEPAFRSAENNTCLVVGYLDITASAPLFIAEDQAFFSKNDVCIEKQRFATSNQLVDALAANRLDYIVETSAVPALALQAKSPGRFHITAASTISKEQPFDAIIVRAESSLTDLQDLQGKKIAVFPGTTAQTLLEDFLKEQGLTTENITFLPTPPQNLLASVKAGAVDAAHVYEPSWALALVDQDLRQLFGTVYGRQLAPNPQGISLISSLAIEEHPEQSKALVRAFDAALEYMTAHEVKAKEIVGNQFDLSQDAVTRMHLLHMSRSDQISWDSIQHYVDLLIRLGELNTRPNLEGLKLPETAFNDAE